MSSRRPARATAAPLLVAVAAGLAGCQAAAPHAGSGAAGADSSASSPTVTRTLPTTSASRNGSRSAATRTALPNGDVLLDGGAVVLPNRARTPGATNPAVTQATIHRTICRTGYTKTIRPPSDYTTSLKEQQLSTGYAFRGDTAPTDYEEDHLISLELGGSPTSVKNLWPEPYAAADGARVKDRIENELHDLVCSGRLTLLAADHAIATNWWTAYRRYGGEGAPTVWDGAYDGSTGTTGTGMSSSGPSGATARCRDGTYSYSKHRSGTCSRHGGVEYWANPPPA